MAKPKTLREAIRYFSDEANCIRLVAEMRWPHGPCCPSCGHMQHYWLETQKRWKCKECWKQFSVKVGTIFEESPIALDKWLIALWMLVNCKNGVSSYEVARVLGITQKSGWFVLHRLRLALQNRSLLLSKAGGPGKEVEADETFVGGKAKNMHKSRKLKINQVRSEMRRPEFPSPYPGKTTVMGVLDRETRKVRATVIPNIRRETLQAEVLNQVKYGSKLYTDNAVRYDRLKDKYVHGVVDHIERYVNGQVHTNGLENFWSLLKRSLSGTYVAVEPFHLSRYCDEQVFRYNNRKDDNGNPISDSERFEIALSQIAGRRLTYSELTGKEGGADF